MKKKVFNAKLNLKKETISKLNGIEMSGAKGGSSWLCVAETAATIFVAGHEESYWACDFTHGPQDGPPAPMNTMEQGCNGNWNA